MLADHLRAQAEAYPNAVAYRVVDGDTMTYAEWEAESNRLARALVAEGIGKGARVAVYLSADEALHWMVAYSAVHKAGAVAVPTNTRLSGNELARLWAHAEPGLVLTEPALAAAATAAAAQIPQPAPVTQAPVTAGTEEAGWSWGAVTAGQGADTFQVAVEGDDLADILYTSGTTGLPKGVAVRHRNAALVPGRPRPSYSGRAWLHASPLFTFAGIGFVYNPMQIGLWGYYQPRFDAGRWIEAVEEVHPQMVFLVPSMAQLIAAHPRFDTADLSSIEICAVGARRSPRHPAHPAGAHAGGLGLQQLRHDRGRLRLLHHAQGGGAQTHRIGGQAPAPARGALRRRRGRRCRRR